MRRILAFDTAAAAEHAVRHGSSGHRNLGVSENLGEGTFLGIAEICRRAGPSAVDASFDNTAVDCHARFPEKGPCRCRGFVLVACGGFAVATAVHRALDSATVDLDRCCNRVEKGACCASRAASEHRPSRTCTRVDHTAVYGDANIGLRLGQVLGSADGVGALECRVDAQLLIRRIAPAPEATSVQLVDRTPVDRDIDQADEVVVGEGRIAGRTVEADARPKEQLCIAGIQSDLRRRVQRTVRLPSAQHAHIAIVRTA